MNPNPLDRPPSRLRVFIAMSLDGYIAGVDDDLSWLPPPVEGADFGYDAFMSGIGALLMGRRTFDVVAAFDPWPYGDRPVLVATHRHLPKTAHAEAIVGELTTLIECAKTAAKGRDVYLDGGQLIRQALDASLVDELIVSIVPVVLGKGVPLFAGAEHQHALELVRSEAFQNGLVQLTYRPRGA